MVQSIVILGLIIIIQGRTIVGVIQRHQPISIFPNQSQLHLVFVVSNFTGEVIRSRRSCTRECVIQTVGPEQFRAQSTGKKPQLLKPVACSYVNTFRLEFRLVDTKRVPVPKLAGLGVCLMAISRIVSKSWCVYSLVYVVRCVICTVKFFFLDVIVILR